MKITLFALLLTIALPAAAQKATASDITGKWLMSQCLDPAGKTCEINGRVILNLNPDGTYALSETGQRIKGRWEIRNLRLYLLLNHEDGTEVKLHENIGYTYDLSESGQLMIQEMFCYEFGATSYYTRR